MSIVTIIWSMTAAASLMLAVVYVFIWIGLRRQVAHLAFSMLADQGGVVPRRAGPHCGGCSESMDAAAKCQQGPSPCLPGGCQQQRLATR